VAPKMFGHYELLEEAQRDTYTISYKARDTRLSRLGTLKTHLPTTQPTDGIKRHLLREARAHASVLHPNVVEIREAGEFKGFVYLAFEWIDGTSLAATLDGTPWPINKALKLVEALSRGVGAVHGQGLVHGDVNPMNVLLTTDGQPKLSGFAWARPIDQCPIPAMSSGFTAGTPGYIAPELDGGVPTPARPESDVYSLGAILYQLLMGELPGAAAPRRELPLWLEAMVARCLDTDPASRHPTATALADEIRRILDA
jgi:eukaryotic-like serine/threonine-protein kinase